MITAADRFNFESFIIECAKNCWYISGVMEDTFPDSDNYPNFVLTVTKITDALRDKFRTPHLHTYPVVLKVSPIMHRNFQYYWPVASTIPNSTAYPIYYWDISSV